MTNEDITGDEISTAFQEAVEAIYKDAREKGNPLCYKKGDYIVKEKDGKIEVLKRLQAPSLYTIDNQIIEVSCINELVGKYLEASAQDARDLREKIVGLVKKNKSIIRPIIERCLSMKGSNHIDCITDILQSSGVGLDEYLDCVETNMTLDSEWVSHSTLSSIIYITLLNDGHKQKTRDRVLKLINKDVDLLLSAYDAFDMLISE